MVGIGGWTALLLIGLLAVVGGERHTEVPELDVFRMIQYDQGEVHRGSLRSGITMLAAPPNVRGDITRRVIVLELELLTEELLEEFLVDRSAGALLIVLPDSDKELSHEQKNRWAKIETNLMQREVQISVYFTFNGEQAKKLIARVGRNSGDVQLVAPRDDAVRMNKVDATNFQGVLAGGEGSQGSGSSDNLPSIAIVANYDSFGVAPGLATGADSNGSGMIAVMELARLFNKLYSGARTRGNYNLIFVLTAAGRFNYAGTKHWLSYTDTRFLDHIEFALCLDSIGMSDELHLHSSKPLKDDMMNKIFSTMSSVASDMGVPFQFVHKKINISDSTVFWEHEQFSRKRILAATLSGLSKPDSAERSSILDRKVNQDILRRNIHLIANSVAKHIYGLTNSHDIFNGSTAVQTHFIAAWSEALARQPRLASSMEKEWLDLVARAGDVLKDACSEGSKQTFKLESDTVVYKGKASTKMSVYSVRPFTFDLVMAVCVLGYLFVLLVLLQGPVEAKNTLRAIIQGKTGARIKSAKQDKAKN